MTKEDLKNLNKGDLVKGKSSGKTFIVFIVDYKYGSRLTAVETVDITNPDEWDLIFKADYKKQ